MTNYLDQWRMHVLTEMGTKVSKCRPLWDVLEGIRHLLCGHILSPFVCVQLKTINYILISTNNKLINKTLSACSTRFFYMIKI